MRRCNAVQVTGKVGARTSRVLPVRRVITSKRATFGRASISKGQQPERTHQIAAVVVMIVLLCAQIVDFDGESLRRTLPRIVVAIEGALSAGGRVYVHCTAGLGRAPAACIAWRYWFDGLQLDEVRTQQRPIEAFELRPGREAPWPGGLADGLWCRAVF